MAYILNWSLLVLYLDLTIGKYFKVLIYFIILLYSLSGLHLSSRHGLSYIWLRNLNLLEIFFLLLNLEKHNIKSAWPNAALSICNLSSSSNKVLFLLHYLLEITFSCIFLDWYGFWTLCLRRGDPRASGGAVQRIRGHRGEAAQGHVFNGGGGERAQQSIEVCCPAECDYVVFRWL